jgi:hypothetical protein
MVERASQVRKKLTVVAVFFTAPIQKNKKEKNIKIFEIQLNSVKFFQSNR